MQGNVLREKERAGSQGTGPFRVSIGQGRGSYFANTFFRRAKRGNPFSLTISVSPWMRGRQ